MTNSNIAKALILWQRNTDGSSDLHKQQPVANSWPEFIFCGFSSKTPLTHFCGGLYNEGNKTGNSGCHVSGLSLILSYLITISLTNCITQWSCRRRIPVVTLIFNIVKIVSELKYDLIWSFSTGHMHLIIYTNNLLLLLAIVDSNKKVDPKR